MTIDLNADLGEGVGADAEMLHLVTSANISCGAHAGDPAGIYATLELATERGVVVGAHPGYPDRANFGRAPMKWTEQEVWAHVMMQAGGLEALAEAADVEVLYLKPHGALYHEACRDAVVARAVVAACVALDLAVVGLPGSKLEDEAEDFVEFIPEGFADRRYQSDGTLVPRTEPNALIHDPVEAVAQIERLVKDFEVQTICVHGDSPGAVAFTKAVREKLLAKGFELKAFS
ncbi:MAG TPA: 5-oxoprolinase subunit PxpA [Fimbriiglobus sp.]|jgi:UPF0271 protein